MDADEIRALLGDNIFERAKKYRKRIQQSTCTVNEDGVRHISAMVQGSGGSYYYTQAWLRENGSFVSASCSCPYNQNGEGNLTLLDPGREIAERIYGRHRLLTHFFMQLGVDEKTAAEDACKAEHILSEQTLEKIRARAIETDAELAKPAE